jgi:hypothetical protein
MVRFHGVSILSLILITTILDLGLQAQSTAKPGIAQAGSTAQNQALIGPSSRIAAPVASYRYPDGQTFTYIVDWRLVNAGTTTVRLDTVNGERHVVADADSIGAVALLYHVHDRLETFFNPQTNCTLSLKKHTEEGFRRLDTSVRYDYSRNKAVLDEQNFRAKNQKHEEIDIPHCVSDTLSAVYYVASQPLQPNSKFIFPSSDGGKPAEIEVTVEARETVKTPSGSYNTVRISAEALSGPQQGKGKIWMWYSDDARRIPVQMRARAFWGTMTFHLTQIGTAAPEKAGE